MNQKKRLSESLRARFGSENMAIWLVAFVGLSLSFAALLLIREQLEAHTTLDFEWVSHNRIRAIDYGIENSMLALATVRDHVQTSGDVDGEHFQQFAGSLLKRHQGLQSVMWVEAVSAQQRSDFAESASRRQEGYRLPDLDGAKQVVPAAERDEYFPVLYTTYDKDSDIVQGLNLGSIPGFAETLSHARDQGEAAASARIAYSAAERKTEYGFMVAIPVFQEMPPPRIPEERKAKLQGFVVGLFRMAGLTNAAISLLEPRGVEILFLDETGPPEKRFLYFYNSRLSPRDIGPVDYQAWWDNEDEPKVTELIRVADRQFAIICGRTDSFRSAEAFKGGPWVVLMAGLLFTVLLSFYLARIRESDRERSAMERQLVEREELFRQMTETVDEGFWATEVNGEELLYLSPAYSRILGIASDDERPSLLDAAVEDDRPKLSEALARLGQDGVDTEVQHRIRRADGMLRWVRTRGFAVRDNSARIYRLVGFMEDITERKLADEALRASEANLRELFQQSPDIIMTVDVEGKILLMNRSIPALPAERAVGRNSLAVMPREFRKGFRKTLKKVFRKGVSRKFQYSADDGTYWEGRIAPIRNEEGPITAAMVIAGDVTEKRDLEAQALRNARLASIGVLAAGVAHEINNPNNAIQFNANLVARAWADITPILQEYFEENGDFAMGGLAFSEAHETFPQLLSEVAHNSNRIRRIVQNLKHMSRQDAGELSEQVDMQRVLEASTMVLHNQNQKLAVACNLDIPDELPAVPGNSQQLEQVFINVLMNALQSLPDRSKGVYVKARYDEPADRMVVVVRDEGGGISERDMGRLTEPFFTTRTEADGTGLGLSISRSIVERHGGSIKFESRSGEGTTVTIKLPVSHKA